MTWFHALTLRERILVGGLMPVALIALAYAYVWLPLNAARDAAIADVAAYRLVEDTARLAQEAGDQIVTPVTPLTPSEPLATRITRSAETAAITLRRVEPDGDGIRVTLDETPFAQLVLWLADLEQSSAVIVIAIEVDRRPAPGIVTTRILLEDL